jgi:hypothetical protein
MGQQEEVINQVVLSHDICVMWVEGCAGAHKVSVARHLSRRSVLLGVKCNMSFYKVHYDYDLLIIATLAHQRPIDKKSGRDARFASESIDLKLV